MANDSEEMQVWYVTPDTEGKNNRIVFDDSDDMLEYAHDVLDALFDRLGTEDEEDCEILTIERGKRTRGPWGAIAKVNGGDGRYDLHGEVCLNGDGNTPPSEDPRDWQGECWAEDGRYYYGPESDLDLMEVQE